MKKLTCFKCGEEIYFDSTRKSLKGKPIPLVPSTNEPHYCPKSDYRPRKTLGDEVVEQDERDRERIRKTKYD